MPGGFRVKVFQLRDRCEALVECLIHPELVAVCREPGCELLIEFVQLSAAQGREQRVKDRLCPPQHSAGRIHRYDGVNHTWSLRICGDRLPLLAFLPHAFSQGFRNVGNRYRSKIGDAKRQVRWVEQGVGHGYSLPRIWAIWGSRKFGPLRILPSSRRFTDPSGISLERLDECTSASTLSRSIPASSAMP